MGFFPDSSPKIPVWNEDGTTAGYIDEPEDGRYGGSYDDPYYQKSGGGAFDGGGGQSDDSPRLVGDWDQPPGPDQPKRSIWDGDVAAPGDEYKYKPPPKVPPAKPQGFWGAGGGGNPWWGAPSAGQRWGDDPAGGYDPRTGQPDEKGGSVRNIGAYNDAKRKYGKKVADVVTKYQSVRHPTRRLKKKIKADLSAKIPRAQVRKVMKDQKWL